MAGENLGDSDFGSVEPESDAGERGASSGEQGGRMPAPRCAPTVPHNYHPAAIEGTLFAPAPTPRKPPSGASLPRPASGLRPCRRSSLHIHAVVAALMLGRRARSYKVLDHYRTVGRAGCDSRPLGSMEPGRPRSAWASPPFCRGRARTTKRAVAASRASATAHSTSVTAGASHCCWGGTPAPRAGAAQIPRMEVCMP